MYECHLTFDLKDAGIAATVASGWGWKTSQIDRDPVLGDNVYFYLTKHNTNFVELMSSMNATKEVLRGLGVVSIRSKIELIVYDTKTNIGT